MIDARKKLQIANKPGFIAALDQSGGSTPAALRLYGINEADYNGDDEMYRLMHEMRVRIMTAPAFSGDKVIGAILFEKTMDGEADGKPVPTYLWKDRGIVTFLKIDKGLEPLENGVQLMKPVAGLDELLSRAVAKGIFGTKMRSFIAEADREGIAGVVRQQFELGRQILNHGLIPIIEPEVSIKSLKKEKAEDILREEILRELDALPHGVQVILKLTIPTVPDTYASMIDHRSVLRVVALSGGYTSTEACEKLSVNTGVIASFSRALTEDLRVTMTDQTFDTSLAQTIDKIYAASAVKSRFRTDNAAMNVDTVPTATVAL